jgi:hypothetical protein
MTYSRQSLATDFKEPEPGTRLAGIGEHDICFVKEGN